MLPILTPVTEIKRSATKIIARLKRNRVPVLITERGRSAAVLVDVATWEAMQERIAVQQGIARGEQALREGRVISQEEMKKRFRKWLDAAK